MNDLVEFSVIEEIVDCYEGACEHLGKWQELLIQAEAERRKAEDLVSRASNNTGHYIDGDRPVELRDWRDLQSELDTFNKDPDRMGRVALRALGLRIWHAVFDRAGLEALVDRKAVDELRKQLQYQPIRNAPGLIGAEEIAKGIPAISVANIEATVAKLVRESPALRLRGIATVFSDLDPRFKSHDAFRFGSRIIVTWLFDEDGRLNWRSDRERMVRDIEKYLLLMRGENPLAPYDSLIDKIRAERECGKHQSQHESRFFRIRVYMNGNCHLWFRYKEDIDTVNRALAEYYGATLGEHEREEDPIESRSLVPMAKNFGEFFTSVETAETVACNSTFGWGIEGGLVLDPSAGHGALLRAVHGYNSGFALHAFEIQAQNVSVLRCLSFISKVVPGDFLKMVPTPIYDRVIMNPPFGHQGELHHVLHAMKFLKPGGVLVSILPAASRYRDDKRTLAFHKALEAGSPRWSDLPAGSFAHAGTMVNTTALTVKRAT